MGGEGGATSSLLVLGAGALVGSALTLALISWKTSKSSTSSSSTVRKQLIIPSLVKNPTYEPFLEPSKTVNGEIGTCSGTRSR